MNEPNTICGCCLNRMSAVGSYRGYRQIRCDVCGHERFVAQEISVNSRLYEEDPDYNGDLGIACRHEDLLQWSHFHAIQKIEALVKEQRPRILDVGCFNGFFVKELRNRGFDATGVDFNQRALEFGQRVYNLGEYISELTLDEIHGQGRRFEVITLFEVIEHLDNFELVMEQALRLLLPGGLLIISTPNNNMSWRPPLDFPPHHLARFGPQSLQELVERFRLKVLFHAEQASIFDMLRNYVGLLMRKKSAHSMRGGEFHGKRVSHLLRMSANRSKTLIYRLVKPLDELLYLLRFRYISQIMIAQKSLGNEGNSIH